MHNKRLKGEKWFVSFFHLSQKMIQKRFKPLFNFINSGYKFSTEANSEIVLLLSFNFFLVEYQIIGQMVKSDWNGALNSIKEATKMLDQYPHLDESKFEFLFTSKNSLPI
jgi:hypothetical protein